MFKELQKACSQYDLEIPNDFAFIHMHGHSEKSFKDGLPFFKDILDRAKENLQPAIAITDHGFMYDAGGFYLLGQKHDVTPILGCEIYVLPEGVSATVKKSDDPDEESNKKDTVVSYFHLVLVAQNAKGLENIQTLCSIANDCGYDGADTDHFYYKPRIKREDLEKYSEGVICSSACLGGEIQKLISSGNDKEAIKVAKLYKEIYGDNFYLELQLHDTDIEKGLGKKQHYVNKKLITLSKKFDIPLILTNDYHYCKQKDYEDHKLLKCISYDENYKNPKNYDKYFPTDQFFIKDDKEMLDIALVYGEYGLQAYLNTYNIYKTIDLKIDTNLHFPKDDLEGKYETSNEKLADLVLELSSDKYDMDDEETAEMVNARCRKELKDIEKGQFPDYFLNVYKIIKYSKDNNILIGPGRGSAGASVVANILNITDIDPIVFDLIWERFWNPGRCVFSVNNRVVSIESETDDEKHYIVKYEDTEKTHKVLKTDIVIKKASPPDIDIDIPSNRREEVIEFTKSEFGYHRVANIVTFGTYKARKLVEDGGKALGYDKEFIDKVKDTLPWAGSPTIHDVIDSDSKHYSKELTNLMESDKKVKSYIERLCRIGGRSTHASTHAGGVIITDVDMYKYTPVFKAKNGFTTQYPYETLESLGVLKIDLLGHEAEVIMDNACVLIKERHGIEINPYKIPMDDRKTFELFASCRMNGIPQLQSGWVIPIIQDVMSKGIDETTIEDIIALVTMIRPGSLNSGQTDKYRQFCLGEKVKPNTPALGPIVEKYCNCLLYQEQIMQIATDLGGFPLDKADALRKVCAKTKYLYLAEELIKELEKGMKENRISAKECEDIIDIVKDFFAYSFNKAHAAGYGVTSYRIAYLKAHYFVELTCAQLNSVIGDKEKTALFLDEIIAEGYKIYPPDINRSSDVWECCDDGIIFPLNAIADVGPGCVNFIVEERDLHGEYKSFEDFIARTPGKSVRINNIESLIIVDAFGSLDYTIRDLYEQYQNVVPAIRDAKKSGKALFGANAGKSVAQVHKSNKPDFPLKDKQADEKELLGMIISLTEDELNLRKKQINRGYDKLKNGSDKSNIAKKRKIEEVKRKTPEIAHKDGGILNRKASARDKLKNIQTDENEVEDDTDVKNSIKQTLGVKEKKVKIIEDKREESICVIINNRMDIIKLLPVVKKNISNSGMSLIIRLTTEDGSSYDVTTDIVLELDDTLLERIGKRIGKDNMFILR